MLQHHQFFYIRADNFHMHLFQFQGKSLLFQLWSVFQTELDPYGGEKDIQHCLKNMESYINHNSCLYVFALLLWPYLWTNFETKCSFGLPRTHGWLGKYKISKLKKKNLKISLLECLFPPWMPLRGRGLRRRELIGDKNFDWMSPYFYMRNRDW